MDQEMLNIAIDNLSDIPDLMVEVISHAKKPSNTPSFDGELKFFYDNFSFCLPFIIKRNITSAQLPFIQDRLSQNGVLIFESATKAVKEELRKLSINYLEVSGNIYIRHRGVYIFVDTNKKIKLEDASPNAAFSKTGLKVIYHLLNDSHGIDYSYRELGEVAGVSIDTVGRVYRELVRDKYLVKLNDRKYRIVDYERMFKDWVTLFNKTLRPKLKKRSFRFTKDQNVRSLLDINFDGKIGGELAAEKLSNFNIAEKANIYVKGSFVELAMELALRPDKDGKITMIEQFWNDTTDAPEQFVGFPLTYADLISDPTPRNIETAKLIFNEYAYQSV